MKEYHMYEKSPETGFQFLLLTTMPGLLANLVKRGWHWDLCLQGQGVRLRPPCPLGREGEDYSPELPFHK